jgi:di/tricarboxylate transporter
MIDREDQPLIDVETAVNESPQELVAPNAVLEIRQEIDRGAITFAPKAPPIARLREYLKELPKLKKFFIGGLVAALLFILISQLIFRLIIVPNEFDGGPVPVPLAIEQLGPDLELPSPPPPPSPPDLPK